MARVLLVEPEKHSRKIFRDCLAAEGHEVKAVNNFVDGLGIALEWLPELVVTGIGYTKEHGLVFIKALGMQVETMHTPIIVVSAHAFDVDRFRSLYAGANCFLAKPVRPSVLIAHVRAFLPARSPADTQRACR